MTHRCNQRLDGGRRPPPTGQWPADEAAACSNPMRTLPNIGSVLGVGPDGTLDGAVPLDQPTTERAARPARETARPSRTGTAIRGPRQQDLRLPEAAA